MLVSLIVGCGLLADGWLCVQAVDYVDYVCNMSQSALTHIVLLQQVKLLFKLRLRLVDFGVEIVACWLDKVTRSSGIFSRESVCKVVKVGGARTDFRSASFLNSFKCCHTPHPDLKYILGSVSFLFSCYAPDFHQALDLCSCVMGYLRISDDHFDKESAKLHRNIASVNLALITSMFSYCCLFCIRLRCSWSLLDFVPQESQ